MPTLYVTATPIGNLSEVSRRVLDTLGQVGLIAAEDTRVTGGLLNHFGIRTPMTSLHRHNEGAKAGGIIRRMLDENMDVALVTDAGTPAISDPGHILVDAAWDAGISVLAIAGPSAVAAALSVSGFDAREFAFYGFLPREKGDLNKKLLAIAKGPQVAVLYESPYRVKALVGVIAKTLPGCRVCACCDLTKLHEKTLRGDGETVLAALMANPKAEKGEYCLVLDMGAVALPEAEKPPDIPLPAQLFGDMQRGLSMQEAIAAATLRGAKKNDAKRAALLLKSLLPGGTDEGMEK